MTTGRVLIDLGNLRVGGGVQAGASLLDEIALFNTRASPRWSWLQSAAILATREVVANTTRDLSSVRVTLDTSTPGTRTITPRNPKEFDVSFTLFGPDYGRPRASRRVVGFADGAALRPELSQSRKSRYASARSRFRARVARTHFARADRIVVEAQHTSEALISRWGYERRKIVVVPNAVNRMALQRADRIDLPEWHGRVLAYPARGYPHKNIDVLGPAAEIANADCGFQTKFALTLTASEWAGLSAVTRSHSFNLGPLQVTQLRTLYEAVSGTIFLSLNESFSVTPLEAMWCGSPLIASDRSFASDIAGPAAIYCEPTDPHSIAKSIHELYCDPQAREYRVAIGRERASAWPSAADRAAAYLDLIEEELGRELS